MEPDRVLAASLQVFLSIGFHAATIDELQLATGMSWDEVRRRYVDKEGLFLSAIEHRLNEMAGNDTAPGEREAVQGLLRRVTAAGSNVMLRAQHRDALERLSRLAEAIGAG